MIEHGYVVINDGRIEQIASGEYDGMLETVDAQGQHVLPGFIDIHIHGDMVLMPWMHHMKD